MRRSWACIVILLLAELLSADAASAGTVLVPEQEPAIDQGLAAAEPGDTVSIAPGVYYEHDLVLPIGVSLVGRSMSPEAVIIDAQLQGRVLLGEGLDDRSVLENFTARAGNSQGWPGSGLILTGPCTLRNVVIEDCYFSQGGRGIGAYCHSVALIENCIFRNNESSHADSEGGGLRVDGNAANPTQIIDCSFVGNTAGRGGGLYVSASVCEGLLITDNIALGNGGGIALLGNRCWVRDCVIAGNEAASHGGGIWVNMNCEITGCTVVGNRTDRNGGGLYSACSWDQPYYPELVACLIAFNSADGSGGGVRQHEVPTLSFACCDVFGNAPDDYGGMNDPTGQDGNFSADPVFCDELGGDAFTIRENSPCAPEHSPCGMLIGAGSVDCSATAVAPSSWSRIKSLF